MQNAECRVHSPSIGPFPAAAVPVARLFSFQREREGERKGRLIMVFNTNSRTLFQLYIEIKEGLINQKGPGSGDSRRYELAIVLRTNTRKSKGIIYTDTSCINVKKTYTDY